MKSTVLPALAAVLAAAALPPAHAGDGAKSLSTVQLAQTDTTRKSLATPLQKQRLKAGAGGAVTGTTLGGKTVMELTTSDCKKVGGKVITVTDGRCGASGQYCRMPDTNAVCIDVKDE